MLSEKIYETMRKKYGGVSSWGIWGPEGAKAKSGVGDLSIFQSVDLKVLNTGYVFVGLNVAGDGTVERMPDWANFHSEYRTHHDFKLRYALRDTPFWGSYFTDIIKLHSDSDGGNVMKYIKQHPDILKKNIESFEEEIGYLGGHPILIAMGDKTYGILRDNLGHKYEIKKMSHYARAVSKESYREELLRLL
ncbi:hypothetical protein [Butyrivibrio fibrisolvens]|uniref:hypothetical protein n=1 Tax=Butyrivibrio fibrisolvens TaxID=831 RepID=UPI0004261306|nr:hypothetical protein [Butyrivibrio fibrisolvens]